jgi:hypothetical protein
MHAQHVPFFHTAITKHIKPAIGHIPLQLTTSRIENYYASLKISPRSIQLHHVLLTSAVKAAIRAKLLHRADDHT